MSNSAFPISDLTIEPSTVPASDKADALKQIRFTAMDLLARREHAQKELRQKLRRRYDQHEMIEMVIKALADENWQSDERFAEAFVASRIRKGQGPIRIAMELRERGISDELVTAFVDSSDTHWKSLAADVRERRFGVECPSDMKTKAKQMRFLQYRGFTPEQVRASLSHPSW